MTTWTRGVAAAAGLMMATTLGAVPALAQSAAEPIKIGVSVGLTGYAAAVDRAWRDGLEVAAEFVNAKGGVLGRKVQLVVEDNKGEPQEAAEVLAPAEHDPVAAGLLARTRLLHSDVPDIQAGLAAIGREDWQQAFASLVDAVTAATDRKTKDDLRKMLIGQFRELGDTHPLVPEYRKRLARAIN